MAVMQEDMVKLGVRTRKRNKSIKESAKLVNLLFLVASVLPTPFLFSRSRSKLLKLLRNLINVSLTLVGKVTVTSLQSYITTVLLFIVTTNVFVTF
jgi:hypothetical protein